jgi:hypothetical protein
MRRGAGGMGICPENSDQRSAVSGQPEGTPIFIGRGAAPGMGICPEK